VESVVSTSQTRGEEFKVKLQFDSPGSINPLKLTKVLHDAVGTVDIKPLRDGSLMITCSDAKQRNDMIKMTNLGGREIKCFVWGQKKTVQGVITGISTELTTEEILENVSGAKVVKARRLLYLKNGTKQESLSILLQFQEEMLPTRVKVGFMSFQVRPYVPPPLRCFKCQRFGHVAAICRGKQRCGKCGGEDHEYGKCNEGTKNKCCNCGGEHSAVYKGCEAHKRAADVQRIRVEGKMTYAEAIKVVNTKRNVTVLPIMRTVEQRPGQGSEQRSGRGSERRPGQGSKQRQDQSSEQRQRQGQSPEQRPGQSSEQMQDQSYNKTRREYDRPIATKSNIGVDSVVFVAFLAEVVNCSAQTQSRTERIKIIIKAAQKYLNLGELTVDAINETLIAGIQETQTTCGES